LISRLSRVSGALQDLEIPLLARLPPAAFDELQHRLLDDSWSGHFGPGKLINRL
jgi:hypothetical protein